MSPEPKIIAFDIDQPLGCSGRINAGRTAARDIQSAPGAFTAAHGKDDCFGRYLEQAVGAVYGGDDFVTGNIHNHGIKFIRNVQLLYPGDKTAGIFRPGQFFFKGMKAEAVMDALV